MLPYPAQVFMLMTVTQGHIYVNPLAVCTTAEIQNVNPEMSQSQIHSIHLPYTIDTLK